MDPSTQPNLQEKKPASRSQLLMQCSYCREKWPLHASGDDRFCGTAVGPIVLGSPKLAPSYPPPAVKQKPPEVLRFPKCLGCHRELAHTSVCITHSSTAPQSTAPRLQSDVSQRKETNRMWPLLPADEEESTRPQREGFTARCRDASVRSDVVPPPPDLAFPSTGTRGKRFIGGQRSRGGGFETGP